MGRTKWTPLVLEEDEYLGRLTVTRNQRKNTKAPSNKENFKPPTRTIVPITQRKQEIVSCLTQDLLDIQESKVAERHLNKLGRRFRAKLSRMLPGSNIHRTVSKLLSNVRSVAPELDVMLKLHLYIDWVETGHASAFGSGAIFLSTKDILEKDNPVQLAFIIGHEIGHIIARHGAEHDSKFPFDPETGVELLEEMELHRETEAEADKIGMFLMAKAGYDPREAICVLGKRDREDEYKCNGDEEWSSTHPTHENQSLAHKELLPHALTLFKTLPKESVTQEEWNSLQYDVTEAHAERYDSLLQDYEASQNGKGGRRGPNEGWKD